MHDDYTDWLGPAADDLTPDQREAFTTAADAYYTQPHITDRDPDDYLAHVAEDDAALTAILQSILHEGSLEQAAREVRQAQATLTGWIRGEAARGTSEAEIARRTGVARDTVRRHIGKRK